MITIGSILVSLALLINKKLKSKDACSRDENDKFPLDFRRLRFSRDARRAHFGPDVALVPS